MKTRYIKNAIQGGILLLCSLLLPTSAYASNMAGLMLAFFNLEVTILIFISLIVPFFTTRKKAYKFVCFVDALVIIQSIVVLVTNWELADDIELRNVFLFQCLILFVITIVLWFRQKE